MLTGGLLLAASLAAAQRPGGGPAAARKPAGADDLVARMMAFDKDKDGKLTRAEVTDERLHRLFDRADADKDGIVTKEELTALAAKERDERPRRPARLRPPGGGPPGGGPGGPMMGPPRPGEILPPMLQDRLRLTAEQKTQLEDLQKEVDAKLEKILERRAEDAAQADARARPRRVRPSRRRPAAGRHGPSSAVPLPTAGRRHLESRRFVRADH